MPEDWIKPADHDRPAFCSIGLPDAERLPPEYPIPAIFIDQNKQNAVAEKFNLMRSEKILALCPGAEYGEAKRWPASYYAEVAQA